MCQQFFELFVKYLLVLQSGIDPASTHYQCVVLPLYYKSKTGCCSIAGNRTPITTTVPYWTACQILAAKKVCCVHPKIGTPRRIRTDTILLLRETPHTNWARGAYK